MVIDTPLATLIAAIIAALASIYNVIAIRFKELRSARRKIIENSIEEISQAIHEINATSVILANKAKGTSKNHWMLKAKKSQTAIKQIRPKIRYSLWGIDLGIRTLSRLPDWVLHLSDNPKATKSLLEKSNELTLKLDIAIKNCYLTGKPPSKRKISAINKNAQDLKSYYDKSMINKQKPSNQNPSLI